MAVLGLVAAGADPNALVPSAAGRPVIITHPCTTTKGITKGMHRAVRE